MIQSVFLFQSPWNIETYLWLMIIKKQMYIFNFSSYYKCSTYKSVSNRTIHSFYFIRPVWGFSHLIFYSFTIYSLYSSKIVILDIFRIQKPNVLSTFSIGKRTVNNTKVNMFCPILYEHLSTCFVWNMSYLFRLEVLFRFYY